MSNRHGSSRQYEDRPRYDERERDNGRERDHGPSSHGDYYSSTTTERRDQQEEADVNDGKKLYIGGLPTYGITQEIVMSDFAQYGQIQDCFVPMDRNEGKRIRGIAFITFTEASAAKAAIGAMHGRNYHGRDITVNLARPRAPDPKKTGAYQPGYYSGRYDAGGRLRPEYRNEGDDDDRKPWEGHNSSFHPSRESYGMHCHGNSWDGSGRYGQRDPRPPPPTGRFD